MSLSTTLIGFVDVAVLGHIDNPIFLAAGAVGITVTGFLFWTFAFLRMATTGIIAQLHGGNETEQMARVFHQLLFLGLFLAFALILLGEPLVKFVLYLYHPGQEFGDLIASYVDIRILTAPATFTHFLIWGIFLGMQRPMNSLITVLFINVLNVILDVIFVVLLGLDVAGVALASLIAEYAGLLPALWLLKRMFPAGFASPQLSRWRWAHFRTLISLNYYLFLRTLILMSVFLFFNLQSTKLGLSYVSASSLLINLLMFVAFSLDSIAYAMETLIGNCAGRRDLAGLRKFLSAGLFGSILFGAGFSLFYWLFGENVINLLTNLPEVRLLAKEFLPYLILIPLFSVVAFFYDGVFIGLLKFRAMLVCIFLGVFCVYLPVWYFLFDFGYDGLWIAMCAFMIFRSLFLHGLYQLSAARNTLFVKPG